MPAPRTFSRRAASGPADRNLCFDIPRTRILCCHLRDGQVKKKERNE